MLLTEKVKIKGNSSNIKQYKEKGYDLSINEIIEINTNDLANMSMCEVDVKCDICDDERKIMYKSYYRNIQKYGFYSCPKCITTKCKMTNMEHIGVEFPTQSKQVIKKRKENNIEKFGVDEPAKLKEIYKKTKETKKEKYGDENYNNIEKTKETKKERYGDENYNNRILSNNTCLEKYGTKNISSSLYRKEQRNKFFYDKYDNVISIDRFYIELYCDKGHNYKIGKSLLNERKHHKTILCTECNPVNKAISGLEIQLIQFIQENYDKEIILNDRKLIDKELDIYLPELKLAFEFNGLYWHNELYKDIEYHINKTNLCEEKGIQLIHIWEDDWKHKQEIVKSMIFNKLGKTSNKIFARKCDMKNVSDNKLIKQFLDDNHIQGFVSSSIKIGLFYNNELVSLMTFSKNRFCLNNKNKNNNYELTRFCNKLNTNIVGGASRLLKYFRNNFEYDDIISYADRSHSNGNLYDKLGFEFVHKTQPNYHYVIDDKRFHRFNFRKSELIKDGFDPNKSEHEIMLERKIYRIYNSGNIKYILY
ncbi:hypothetical protein M0Q50_02700 [bacterium]|jgi:hypothetical protein|nr:hypothetical protein [bacterium]